MNTDSFAQMIQTFGANPERWETDRPDLVRSWAETDGAEVLRAQKELDMRLDTVQPPVYPDLIGKIKSVIIRENAQRQLLLFWRVSPWISVACAVFGFCLGWYQNYSDYANTQSYFDTMFNNFYEQY